MSTLLMCALLALQPATRTMTLAWDPPAYGVSGRPLTDLAGYRIRYGMAPDALTQMIYVSDPGITRYTIDDLTPGVWYIQIASVGRSGVESEGSPILRYQLQ